MTLLCTTRTAFLCCSFFLSALPDWFAPVCSVAAKGSPASSHYKTGTINQPSPRLSAACPAHGPPGTTAAHHSVHITLDLITHHWTRFYIKAQLQLNQLKNRRNVRIRFAINQTGLSVLQKDETESHKAMANEALKCNLKISYDNMNISSNRLIIIITLLIFQIKWNYHYSTFANASSQ